MSGPCLFLLQGHRYTHTILGTPSSTVQTTSLNLASFLTGWEGMPLSATVIPALGILEESRQFPKSSIKNMIGSIILDSLIYPIGSWNLRGYLLLSLTLAFSYKASEKPQLISIALCLPRCRFFPFPPLLGFYGALFEGDCSLQF